MFKFGKTAARRESVSPQPEPVNEDKPPLASQEPDDMDVFEDAEETVPIMSGLELAFVDCDKAIRKFFSNDIVGALEIMKPWGTSSVYHSLGASIFEFIPAILTFDHAQIGRAQAAIKATLAVCNLNRRTYSLVESLGTIIKKPNYRAFTDLEAHAELCYAEALLLQAAMTMMEGEDLTVLIKSSIKVKGCISSYKECVRILEKKSWESEVSRVNFLSGVRLGTAAFNLMMSHLPHRIISLLEFVGHFIDKARCLAELEAGGRAPGIRNVLCDLTLLAYHLVICHFAGAEGDLDISDEILHKNLLMYPDGVWFLLFKGRLELMRGQLQPSLAIYDRVARGNDVWRQVRHLCYWEIIWVHGLGMEWRLAASSAGRMIDESSWSRTVYCYTKAAMLLQLGDALDYSERLTCNKLMGSAVHYKQRIAGKSLPMEKFMIRRCDRYQAQGGRLLLPGIELLCLWNMFHIIANNEPAIQNILRAIETARERMESGLESWEGPYAADNRALVCFLHGCCLAAMRLPRMALDALESVLKYKHAIKEDTFLVPYAVAEMAMCHYRLGDKERALQLLAEARKKYSGYSLESRLLFKLHAKFDLVQGYSGKWSKTRGSDTLLRPE